MGDDRGANQARSEGGLMEGAPHDAVGAFVLNALPEEERAAFEAHLAECDVCRAEVAQLAPVVAALPRSQEGSDGPEPPDELRERILSAVREDETPREAQAQLEPEEAAPVEAEDAAPVQAAPAKRVEPAAAEAPSTRRAVAMAPARPRGRIRGGAAGPVAGARKPSALALDAVARWPRAWVAAGVLAVAFVGVLIWALALQGRVNDKDREIAALREQNQAIREENQAIRARANSTAWRMVATAEGPVGAEGTVFFSLPDQRGVVYLVQMPPLSDGRVYQLWYLQSEPGAEPPVPGATFTVDEQGQGFAPIDPLAPTFDVIAVTEEPAGGSDQPTGAILLRGQLAGAAG
ncbi:MAG TPA: anti-sigma factor [Thermomicrobiales bacterium]